MVAPARVDFVVSYPHYAMHLRPVFDALPRWARGSFGRQVSDGRLAVVGGFTDYAKARRAYDHIVLMEHGVGQSYAGDPLAASHPSYAGGRGYGPLAGILAPNALSATRWKRAYPATPVVIVGATYELPTPEGHALGIAFHWDAPICRESGSAWRHYRRGLARLASQLPVVGHTHPRAPSRARQMRSLGLEVEDDLFELARRVSVFAVDNSSTLWEMAVARPVIALDAPWYRRDVYHGLRFWDQVPGPRVADVDELIDVGRALLTHEDDDARYARQATVSAVIPHLDGAQRSSRWIVEWLDGSYHREHERASERGGVRVAGPDGAIHR